MSTGPALSTTAWALAYKAEAQRLAANPQEILSVEQDVHQLLLDALLQEAAAIAGAADFAGETLPCWIAHAPKQRGRDATGNAAPWSEVVERSVIDNMIARVRRRATQVGSVALPSGSDTRFRNHGWLLHLDAKATGPREPQGNITLSSNQVSGDGNIALYNGDIGPYKGHPVVVNNPHIYLGRSKQGRSVPATFHPQLAPFYSLADGTFLICVTSFIKARYLVHSFGDQPIDYLELITCPNGLLLFPTNAHYKGKLSFFGFGKDASRIRVYMSDLNNIDPKPWRVTKIAPGAKGWQIVP